LSLIAILGLINFLAVRYSNRIDFTENQLFTLSPQSQEIVRNLQQQMKVWVFEGEPNPVDKELLETYRRYNPRFNFEYVDPQIEIGVAKQFNVKSLGDVYLEFGNKRQFVQKTLIDPYNNQREAISEIQLTNAIAKIQRDRNPVVYFLQGHGEHPLTNAEGGISQAVSSLKDKGYRVEALNLAERPAIPKDANVIIIAGAKRKLFEGEIKALKDFSDNGGSLLLMLDPNTNLGLETLLKEWGIQLDERVVIDASGNGNALGYGPATPIITSYGKHPITEDFGNGNSLYPLARPIGTVKVDGITAVALLVTNEKMWAESDLKSQEIKFDPTQDIPGPFDLGVAFIRNQSKIANKSEDKKTTEVAQKNDEQASPTNSTDKQKNNTSPSTESSKSRLVVFGNSTFATDGWFEQQLNGDVFLNSVQWLANDEEQTLSIRPKTANNRRILLTPLQAGILSWMSLVIMPLLGLLIAGITWWRRR
jgi:ABC-type uncharacterized transport system involved in gliding motility auxiliary subunit